MSLWPCCVWGCLALVMQSQLFRVSTPHLGWSWWWISCGIWLCRLQRAAPGPPWGHASLLHRKQTRRCKLRCGCCLVFGNKLDPSPWLCTKCVVKHAQRSCLQGHLQPVYVAVKWVVIWRRKSLCTLLLCRWILLISTGVAMPGSHLSNLGFFDSPI